MNQNDDKFRAIEMDEDKFRAIRSYVQGHIDWLTNRLNLIDIRNNTKIHEYLTVKLSAYMTVMTYMEEIEELYNG